jgi:hypothetical protein
MMNTPVGYTHRITYYKNVKGIGWVYSDFRTTADALRIHLRSLAKEEAQGSVRAVSFNKIHKNVYEAKMG